MRRLIQGFQNLKIRRKIQLFSVTLVVLLSLLFLTFYGHLAYNAVERRTVEVAQENLEEIRDYLSMVDRLVSSRLRHLGTSISVQKVMTQVTGGDLAEQKWTVDALLRDIQGAAQIQEIQLFGPAGKFVAGTRVPEEEVLSDEVLAMALAAPDENLWYDDGESFNARTDNISIYRTVCDGNGAVVAVVRVEMNLSDLYSYIGFNLSSNLYLFTTKGNLLLPKETDSALLRVGRESFADWQSGQIEQEAYYQFQKEAYLVLHLPLDGYGLYVASIAKCSQIQEDVQTLQTTILLLGISCIVLLTLFLSFMGKTIARPIVDLSGKMERVREGELSLRTNSRSLDEIGALGRNFDQMLDRIEVLMHEVAEAEKRRHELELISLQTQITPHFLYNSLDNVSALAQMGDMAGAFEMAQALGGFYRGVLSDGRGVISIREELRITDSYLRVQSRRYQDGLTYHIEVDPALLEGSIVKLTLQPLVENAIYHGIRKVRRQGRVVISGRLEEETVVLSVWDNGQGMQCGEELSENTENGDLILHRKGYGMYNADQRIKLCFGRVYGLHVESVPGEWTRVDVRLPLRPYKEYQHDFGFDRR